MPGDEGSLQAGKDSILKPYDPWKPRFPGTQPGQEVFADFSLDCAVDMATLTQLAQSAGSGRLMHVNETTWLSPDLAA